MRRRRRRRDRAVLRIACARGHGQRRDGPVPPGGDADDPAIWVHPDDPASSTIIGTDKLGGLAVYDLDGDQIQYLADGDLNNVDLRDGFRLGGESVTLVTAADSTTPRLAIYRVNPSTRELVDVAAREIELGIAAYGSCMYRSAKTGGSTSS